MKLSSNIASIRRQTGIMLVECLVYISVFAILLGIGTAAFYFCWDHTQSVIRATDKIAAVLHTGERWRADVRGATGKISVETTSGGELLRIPRGKDVIYYSLHDGALRRKPTSASGSELVFEKVQASRMKPDPRGSVTGWCWELELPPPRMVTTVPLSFTFKAAQTKP